MASLEQARRKLRGRYLSRLSESVNALRLAISADEPDFAALDDLTHQLLGSGATYGFPEISAAAAAVRAASSAAVPDHVGELIRVCESAAATTEPHDPGLTPMPSAPVVLIVENDPAMAEMVAELLTGLGLASLIVQSIADARPLLGEKRLVMVIVSLRLPDGSGLDLVDVLRSTRGLSIPAIGMTADGHARIQGALDRGLNACLMKPFEPGAFEANVLSVLPDTLPRNGAPTS